jgi:hypothetical protein
MELQQVLTALRNADAAGDTAAAQRLAQIAQQLSAEDSTDVPAPPVGKGGFKAAFSAGLEGLKGAGYALAGRTGAMDVSEAEAGQQKAEARAKEIFTPNQDGWDSPWEKTKELLGGSLPYMAAPIVAGGAATVAGAPALAAAGLAGLASATQFTGTNLVRQTAEDTKLQDTDLSSAVLAALPQAALDMIGLGRIPGVRQLIGAVAKDVGTGAATKLVGQSAKQIAADYAKATGKAMGAEGVTEAGQQVLERLQAGLAINDPAARKEYWESFVGGAVLGGVLSPAGRYVERSEAQSKEEATTRKTAQEALAKTQQAEADAEEQRKADPNYLTQLKARSDEYTATIRRLTEAAAVKVDATDLVAAADKKAAVQALHDFKTSEDTQALKNELNEALPQIKAAEAEAAAKKAADEKAAAEAEANRPLNEILQEQNALERKLADAKNAGITAMQNGDMDTARSYHEVVAQLTPQAKKLQELVTRRRSEPVNVGALGKMQKAYADAMRTGNTTRADALLSKIAEIYGEQAKQEAAQAAFPEALGAVPGNRDAGMGQFTPPTEAAAPTPQPQNAAPNESNDLLRQLFGTDAEAATADAKSRDLYRKPTAAARTPGSTTNNTLALKQDSMFSDMEQGGVDPSVGKATQLLTQIDQLQSRPNLPAATKQALENYARALAHPEMDNADNAGAQNALERIAENINKIAYQGYGQGEERNLTRKEVNARIAEVDAKLNAWRQDTQAIAQARAALRSAPFEEQASRKQELDALLKPTALLAERERLHKYGMNVSLTPYDRQQKQLTTIGEGTGIAGEATADQVAKAKMVQPKGVAAVETGVPAADTADGVVRANEVDPATGEVIARNQPLNKPARRPSELGREVVGVNPNPETVQEQSSFFGAVDEDGEQSSYERVAPPTITVGERGMARVERGAERAVMQTRALPDDTEVTAAMRELSPADKQTLDLWDNVFGEGSGANRIVRDAEAGLAKAQNAVDVATSELAGLQQALAAALKPVAAQEGDVLPVKRAAEVGAERAAAAEQYAADVKTTADTNFNAAQTEVQRTGRAIIAATEKLKKAKTALDAEMQRLQATGELSQEFLQFIGGSALKAEVEKATAAVADVLQRSKSANAAVVDALLGEQAGLIPHIKSAVTAQQIISDVVPQARKLMGPRIATLVDTMLRVRAAYNIMGTSQELAEVVQQAEGAVAEQTQARDKAVKAAQKQLTAGDKAVTAATVRAEIARAEATAKQEAYQALLDKIEGFTKTDPVAKEAAAAVEEKTTELEQLQKTALDRVTKARTDVKRAKETRKLVMENEDALRSGKKSPLMATIDTNIKNLEAIYHRTEAALRGMWEGPADARAELTEGIMDYENQLTGLARAETALADLWANHATSTVDMEGEAANIIDAAALLTPTVYDTQMIDANRALDKAELVGGARAAAAEEAALMTELDAALKPLRERLKENTKQLENPQSRAHRSALLDHRGRINKQMNETAALYYDRLLMARQTKEQMGEASQMAPDPDSKGWAFEQLLNLKTRRASVQSQLDAIAAAITSIRAEREELVAAERQKHTDVMQTARELGATVRDEYVGIRAKLGEMLNDQRVLEERADKEIATAEATVNEAIARVKEEGHTSLDAMQEYRTARKVYDAAVAARARVYDHSLQMMRDQIELVNSLPPVEKVAPTPQNAFFNSKAPEAEANPAAVAATAKVLEEGAVSGPEQTAAAAEQTAFEERINTTDDPRALRKEKGGYEGDIANIELEIEGLASKTDADHPLIKLLRKNLATAEGKLEQLYTPSTFDRSLPKADLDKAITNMQEAVRLERTRLENGIKGLREKSSTLKQRAHMSPDTHAQLRVDIQRRMAEAQRKLNAAEAARDKHEGLIPVRISKAVANAKEELAAAKDDWKNIHKVSYKNADIRASLLEKKLKLQEKITTITDRLSQLERGPSVSTIAASQGPAVRRGVATKKALNAGDMMSGDTTPIAGRRQADGTVGPASTVAKESTVGTRNKITEKAIHPKTTSESAVAQAVEDTAEGTALRNEMVWSKLARDLEAAVAARAAAKESNDAVQKSKAGPAAKAAAAARLKAAIAAVKAADTALKEDTRTAPASDKVQRVDAAEDEAVGQELDAAPREFEARATAAHQDVTSAIGNNDIVGTLQALVNTASTPELRALASKLLPFVADVKIELASGILHKGKYVSGLYNHALNKVQIDINGVDEETVLHEILHAATMQVLERPAAQLTADQSAAVATLHKLYASIKNNPNFSKEYGAVDLKEFVAELYVDPVLRQKLDALGKPKTMLQRFWEAIKRFFGNATDPDSRKAMDAIDRIMEKSGVGTAAPAARAVDFGKYAGGAMSKLNTGREDTRNWYQRWTENLGISLETGLVDTHAPIMRALEAAGNTKDAMQAKYALREAGASAGWVQSFLSYGAPELFKDAKGFNGIRASKGAPSGMDVLAAAEGIPGGGNTEGKFQMATRYLLMKRGSRVGADKLGSGITQADLDAIRNEVNGDPALKAALENFHKVYNKYNEKLVNFARDTGGITAAKAQEFLQHGDYVPMYRVKDGQLELSFGDSGYVKMGDIANTPFIHALKGGESQIMPINESIIYNTKLLVDVGMVNLAKRNIGYVLSAAGRKTGPNGGHRMVRRDGVAPAGKEYLQWQEEPRAGEPPGEHAGMRYIKIDTEGTVMEGIPATVLGQSIEGFHATMPAFVNWAAKLNDILRAGVTRMPPYTIRQLLRDPMASASTSGLDYNPLTAVKRAMTEYGKGMFGDKTALEEANRHALVQSNLFTGDVDDMLKLTHQIAGGNNPGAVRSFLNQLDRSAHTADAATRILVYKDSIARGLSEVEAAYRTRESMNYHKRGAWATIQFANRMLPFFNSGVQALNVAVKALQGKMPFEEELRIKQTFVRNALMLSIGGMAYAALMQDNDEYKKLKPSDRYGQFHMALPGTELLLKLPVTYADSGGMAWALGQALVDSLGDTHEAKQIIKGLAMYGQTSIPGGGTIPLPPGLKQSVEWATNTDIRTYQPIVGAGLAGSTRGEQYDSNTPETIKAIGGLGISPKQFEHALNSLTGSAASAVLHLLEAAIGVDSDTNADKPSLTADRIPLIKPFIQNPRNDAATEVVYDLAEKAKAAHTTFQRLKREGRSREYIKNYYDENRAEIAMGTVAGSFTQQMGELNNRIKQITNAPRDKYSADRKTELINGIIKQKAMIAQRYMEAVKRMEQKEAVSA